MTEHPDRLLSSVVSAMADCVAEVERLRAALAAIQHEAMHGDESDYWMVKKLHDMAEAALTPKEPSE